jgi:hypothetical protein
VNEVEVSALLILHLLDIGTTLTTKHSQQT